MVCDRRDRLRDRVELARRQGRPLVGDPKALLIVSVEALPIARELWAIGRRRERAGEVIEADVPAGRVAGRLEAIGEAVGEA